MLVHFFAYLTGTYNDQLRSNTTTPCTACPDHLTTSQAGGRSLEDCDTCAVGFGGTDCATQCGGSNATYGPAGREKDAPCEACPVIAAGYFFDYLAVNRNFSPAVVARPGPTSLGDCLAEFAQITDVAFYLGGSVEMSPVAAATFEACVDGCKTDDDCQYITFDYNTNTCLKKTASNNGIERWVPGIKGLAVRYHSAIWKNRPATLLGASVPLAVQ